MLLNEDDIWMTQAASSQLFQTSTQNITMHIKKIYDGCELNESRTCKCDLQVQIEENRKAKKGT